MPVYVSLLRFTQQGVEAVKEQGSRMDRIKEAYRAAGGELIGYYATMGRLTQRCGAGFVVRSMKRNVASSAFRWASRVASGVLPRRLWSMPGRTMSS